MTQTGGLVLWLSCVFSECGMCPSWLSWVRRDAAAHRDDGRIVLFTDIDGGWLETTWLGGQRVVPERSNQSKLP